MTKWRPINDPELPEPRIRVLVAGPLDRDVSIAYRRTKKPPLVWQFPNAAMAFKVTYWAPLPAHPVTERKTR